MSILSGFERSMHLWIGNDIYNFTKMTAILNFQVNMPSSWIFFVFLDIKKKKKKKKKFPPSFTDYITFIAYKTTRFFGLSNVLTRDI